MEEEDLDRLLLPLETRAGGPLTGRGRSEVARAFAENPDGVTAVVRRLARSGTLSNPPGALVDAVRSGDHRQASKWQARARSRKELCPECETGGGEHVDGCPLAPATSRSSEAARSYAGVPAAGNRPGTRPLIGDEGYLGFVVAAFEAGHVTEVEREQAEHAHRFVLLAGHSPALGTGEVPRTFASSYLPRSGRE